MKLIGLCPVRNEDWLLGLSLRAMLMWMDEVIVLLHACSDRSEQICNEVEREYPGRVLVLKNSNPVWTEMEHRTAMLQSARERGATHCAILDADEILTADLLCRIGDVETVRGATDHAPRIRTLVKNLRPGQILRLPGYNLRGGIHRYHSNGIWGNREFSTAFADAPGLGWYGDKHHSREPQGSSPVPTMIQQGAGGIVHLWGASERRLRAKHQSYRINDHLHFPDIPAHELNLQYNLWRSPADCARKYPNQPQWHAPWEYKSVPTEWLDRYQPLMKYLDMNSVPYQEEYCRRLVAQYGRERFAGIDLSNIDLPDAVTNAAVLAS